MEIEMATAFEEAVRAAIQASGLSYTQLAKEAKVDGSAIGRFMNRERGLNSETLGRILDKLGCTLTPVINRYAPKPVGRPRKYYAHEVEMKGALESAKIKTGEMVVEGIRDYDEKADDSSAKGVSTLAKTGASSTGTGS
jgi:transcriptional regulator with XRE-family HTH domain